MTPTLVRYNNLVYSWGSCAFLADNNALAGVVGASHSQRLERPPVPSNVAGAPPLGRPTGRYTLTFSLKMLREDAAQLEAYLANKVDGSQVGRATFTFSASLSEPASLAKGATPITITGTGCTIDGKEESYDEGIDELLIEYTLGCLQITEKDPNGSRTLFSSTPNALDALAQDYVTIGGDKSPGKATILNMSNPLGWDVRLGYGMNKATLVPSGNPPAEFSIKFDLWDAADLPAWNEFAKKWLKKSLVTGAGPAGVTKAISVQHPMLQAQPFSVQDCVVVEPGALEKDEFGLWSCTTKFRESAPPRPALQRATANIPPAGKAAPTAADAVEAANQAALAEHDAAAAAYAATITGGAP